MPVLVAEAGDLLAAHLGDEAPAEERQDRFLHGPAVLGSRRRLEVDGDVLGVEPLSQIANGERLAAVVAVGERIAVVLDRGEVRDRHAARLVRRDHSRIAEAHGARAPADAVLQDERLAARGEHPHPEAGDVAVPEDVCLVPGLMPPRRTVW